MPNDNFHLFYIPGIDMVAGCCWKWTDGKKRAVISLKADYFAEFTQTILKDVKKPYTSACRTPPDVVLYKFPVMYAVPWLASSNYSGEAAFLKKLCVIDDLM